MVGFRIPTVYIFFLFQIAKLKLAPKTDLIDKKKPKEKKPVPIYQPYKCGLCELSHESLQGIKEHCR